MLFTLSHRPAWGGGEWRGEALFGVCTFKITWKECCQHFDGSVFVTLSVLFTLISVVHSNKSKFNSSVILGVIGHLGGGVEGGNVILGVIGQCGVGVWVTPMKRVFLISAVHSDKSKSNSSVILGVIGQQGQNGGGALFGVCTFKITQEKCCQHFDGSVFVTLSVLFTLISAVHSDKSKSNSSVILGSIGHWGGGVEGGNVIIGQCGVGSLGDSCKAGFSDQCCSL